MSFSPVKVCEVELSEPVNSITAPGYGSALVLARWYSEPPAVGDIPLSDGAADARQVAQALWLWVGEQVTARCSAPALQALAISVPPQAGPHRSATPATAISGPQALRES